MNKKTLITGVCLLIFSVMVFSQGNSGAVKLSYKYQTDNPVRYLTNTEIVQGMDINGQSMVVNVRSILGCSIRCAGTGKDHVELEVTIDTLSQTIDTPGEMTGGPETEVIGKVFSMKISPLGKEIDIEEAKKLSYTSGDGTVTTLDQSFGDYFPDVPTEALSGNYSWSTSDSLSNKSPNMDLFMTVNAECRFEGFGVSNGMKCAIIKYTISGYRNMNTRAQGMDIKVTGPYSGTGEIYFNSEKGYFIKHMVRTRMTGQLEITSPENISFPVVMDINTTTATRN